MALAAPLLDAHRSAPGQLFMLSGPSNRLAFSHPPESCTCRAFDQCMGALPEAFTDMGSALVYTGFSTGFADVSLPAILLASIGAGAVSLASQTAVQTCCLPPVATTIQSEPATRSEIACNIFLKVFTSSGLAFLAGVAAQNATGTALNVALATAPTGILLSACSTTCLYGLYKCRERSGITEQLEASPPA